MQEPTATDLVSRAGRRLKVLTLIGTRPELIKLSRVIAELERTTEHILVFSGQNFDHDVSERFFAELEIRGPDFRLNAARSTTMETVAEVLVQVDRILDTTQPEAMLIYGDTNTGLGALAAKRREIPIFHMEAGNRCFDERVPEEINRRLLDHLSDINLPLTEHGRARLLAEGIRADTVIKTGSPLREVFAFAEPGISTSNVLDRLGLTPRDYFLVSAHRQENVDSARHFGDLLDSLEALVDTYGSRVVVSTHPRTRQRLTESGSPMRRGHPHITFEKPFGFFDYLKLQLNARCVLSDSGSLTEESSLLGFPAVALRRSHERLEGMDQGTVVLSGLRRERVLQAVDLVLSHHQPTGSAFRVVPDYDVDNVSKKVVRIILSYVDYVNRTVWHKDV